MSEKQLTVAELLAKAGKEEPGGSSRRRRRRSIEEGGVSVAELTGNIPKVDAKPAESKHSSEPIDPEPVEPTAEDTTSDTPVTTPDGAGVEGDSEAKKAEKVEEKADSSPKSTPVEPFQEQRDDAAEPEEELEHDASEEETHEDQAAEDAANIVLSVVSADEPLRLTTGAFPAQLPEKAESAREDATVVLPAVEDEESLALASLGAATADEADEDYEEDYETEEDFDEAYDEQLAEEDYDEYEEYDDELVDEDATDYDDDEYEEVESDYDDLDEAETEYAAEEATDEAEEKMSIVAVAAMALVGIILGVALFTGFQYLWSTMSKTTVGLIALGVTAALVVLVKLLRTSRDGVSMFLAAIVGLVMTFGPLLVVGF
ncbi:MAG: hypothetical protein Q4A31_04160 [Corynebacterium sp.]|uniref:hypothetical protein n=1 Tax=Corynebacterium sp. TaxID=1720 RepID=UPI0026DC80A4|nr:hypothetical protein [Corynebacterium sp.]MDO4761095.1 hypothetical protein [Corynebacterium sp.]